MPLEEVTAAAAGRIVERWAPEVLRRLGEADRAGRPVGSIDVAGVGVSLATPDDEAAMRQVLAAARPPSPSPSPPRSRRSRLWAVGAGIGAAVLVLLLVLVAAAVIDLGGKTTPPPPTPSSFPSPPTPSAIPSPGAFLPGAASTLAYVAAAMTGLSAVLLVALVLVLISRRSASPAPQPAAAPPSELIATALLFDPDGLFRDSRLRLRLVFRLRLAIALLLAALLAGGLAAVLTGVVLGQLGLAAAGGGTSVADLLCTAVLRPLDQIKETLADTQWLELVHLRCRQGLGECQRHRVLRARIDCQRRLWNDVMADLRQQAGAGARTAL